MTNFLQKLFLQFVDHDQMSRYDLIFLYCYVAFWDKQIENNVDFYDFLNKLLFDV